MRACVRSFVRSFVNARVPALYADYTSRLYRIIGFIAANSRKNTNTQSQNGYLKALYLHKKISQHEAALNSY